MASPLSAHLPAYWKWPEIRSRPKTTLLLLVCLYSSPLKQPLISNTCWSRLPKLVSQSSPRLSPVVVDAACVVWKRWTNFVQHSKQQCVKQKVHSEMAECSSSRLFFVLVTSRFKFLPMVKVKPFTSSSVTARCSAVTKKLSKLRQHPTFQMNYVQHSTEMRSHLLVPSVTRTLELLSFWLIQQVNVPVSMCSLK